MLRGTREKLLLAIVQRDQKYLASVDDILREMSKRPVSELAEQIDWEAS